MTNPDTRPGEDQRLALADRLAGHLGPFNFVTKEERDLIVAALRRSVAPDVYRQEMLRRLVDVVWNEATESTAVPSTRWADKMIAKVFDDVRATPPAPVRAAAEPGEMRKALKAAEQELIDLSRSSSIVFNRTTKEYDFSDAHIERALPGTFAVIKQIRAALSASANEGSGK